MKRIRTTRMAATLFSGLFAVSMIGASSDYTGLLGSYVDNLSFVGAADAKGKKGSAKRYAHKGHHGKPGGNRPHNRPNHRPGHGNNHHHHHNDKWHNSYRKHKHHDYYGRWVAGGVAAGVTAAAIGSIAYSLPRGCREFISGGVRYWDCSGVYYQARYRGSDLTYVVVDRP